MKENNKKKNGLLTVSAIFYIIFALDMIVNTVLAHFVNEGQPMVSPTVMLGPLVVNVISVPISFVVATILLIFAFLRVRLNK